MAPVVSSVRGEEFVNPMCSETVIPQPRPDGPFNSIMEPLGFNVEHMIGVFGKPNVEIESQF